MKRASIALVGAMTLPLLGIGCAQCRRDADQQSGPIVHGLMERLKPDGRAVTAFSGLRWDRAGVHASWEIDTGMDWDNYAAWAKRRMPADFEAHATEGASLVFKKSMDADVYVLRLEPIPTGSPARVRATLDGHPY